MQKEIIFFVICIDICHSLHKSHFSLEKKTFTRRLPPPASVTFWYVHVHYAYVARRRGSFSGSLVTHVLVAKEGKKQQHGFSVLPVTSYIISPERDRSILGMYTYIQLYKYVCTHVRMYARKEKQTWSTGTSILEKEKGLCAPPINTF